MTTDSDTPGEGKPAVTLRLVACPNCGAALDVAAAAGRGVLVCHNCKQVLDTGVPELKLLESEEMTPEPAISYIEIGWEGTFDGVRFRVIGRIRYRTAEWFWDEWCLVSDEGGIRYLEEDEGKFRLLTPFIPSDAPERSVLESSKTLSVEGTHYRVRERGVARVTYFEGQLPWRLKPGSEVSYVDAFAAAARLGRKRLAVEWTRRELEFYYGTKFDAFAVANAFERARVLPAGATDDDDDGEETTSASVILWIVVIVVLIFIFAQSDGGCIFIGGGGHYGGGGFGGK